MADCVEVSSESSSSDTSLPTSSPPTPPPKLRKYQEKKLQPSRGKNMMKHKTRRRKEKRKSKKRKCVSSPSSTSSSSHCDNTESESSDSDQGFQKKARKPKVKKVKVMTKVSRSSSPGQKYSIFQKYYSKLEKSFSTCISTTTSSLFSRRLISEDVLGQVTTSQDSDQRKAQRVLYHVQQLIKVDPGKLRTLVEVLQEEPVFDHLTKEILSEMHLNVLEPSSLKTQSYNLDQYKSYLKNIYSRNPIAQDDKLLIFPCNVFIKLALVSKEESFYGPDQFSKSTFHGGVDQILATKTPLEMDAIVTPGSQFVLVEGPAGIGKSTLCWELCRKWDTLKSLQDFEIVLLVKLRERRVQNATSLHQLFPHRNEELCQSIIDLMLNRGGEKVLLILDGFDEMPTSVVDAESSLIMEVIRGDCLPRATCLVTSRPSALHNKRCFPQEYRHVEILGFTDKRKRKFAEETFQTEPEILTCFEKFIFSNPIITSLMYIPVNCAIIAQVYKELPDIAVPKTMTQLYTLLALVLIRRHLIQTRRWTVESKVPADLEGLPEDIKADLMRVSELAYKGLMKEDVQVMFTDEDVGASFQHLGLMNEAKEMYVFKGAVTYYSFLHLSLQEYLAAWHELVHPDPFIWKSNHLEVFCRFMSGLSGSLDYTWLFRRHYQTKIMFLVSCFYEAQQATDFKPRGNEIYISDSLCMYMFGYALVHTPVQWKVKTGTSFDMLVTSIADHAPDGHVVGSIATLDSDNIVTNLEILPKCLLDSIKAMTLDDDTATAVSKMPNLQEVTLKNSEASNTALALWKIRDLKTVRIHYSIRCEEIVHILCSFFSTSSTVENIELNTIPKKPKDILSHHKLSQSALACPSITAFSTWYPFFALNHSKSLVKVNLSLMPLSPNPPLHCVITCLMSIAFIAKQMSTVKICEKFAYKLSLPPLETCEVAALLNDSLLSNPSLKVEAKFFRILISHLNSLSRAFRKDSDVARMNLRRSKSQYDLSTLKFKALCPTVSIRKVYQPRWDPSRRCQSCPDLLEMQSLHNMHPQLHQAIGTSKLYFKRKLKQKVKRLPIAT